MSPEMEMIMASEKVAPKFLELKLKGPEPAWCVDGRPDTTTEKGPQMLGGSLHPALLSIIQEGEDFTASAVEDRLKRLEAAGFAVGVHRGSHKHPEHGSSDCGFADKLPIVLQAAVSRQGEITRRLLRVVADNQDKLGSMEDLFREALPAVFAKLQAYAPEKVKLTGEPLVGLAEELGATVEDVAGDHAEQVAFVNLKDRTTLDTNGLNVRGQQGFNLDLWSVLNQSEALGVEHSFALLASLVLYQATEMVLVEDKGKPALSIALHS